MIQQVEQQRYDNFVNARNLEKLWNIFTKKVPTFTNIITNLLQELGDLLNLGFEVNTDFFAENVVVPAGGYKFMTINTI